MRLFRTLLPAASLTTICFLTAAVIIGCGRGDRGPRSRFLEPNSLIAFIGPPAGNPQWPAIQGGAKRTAARFPNVRLGFFSPPADDADAVLRTADEVLAQRPKAVCVYVTSPETTGAAVKNLLSKGAVVVTMGATAGEDGVYAHVDATLTAAAEELAHKLDVYAAPGRSYVLLHESGRNTPATQCYDRFMFGAEKQYTMTLLEKQNAAESPHTPRELIRQMLERFENASVVVTFNAQPWLADPPPLTLTPNARFITMSAVPPLWSWLRLGQAAVLIGPIDGEIGELALEFAVEAIADSGRGGVRVVQSQFVTRENLAEFAERYAAAAGVPLRDLWPPESSDSAAAPAP
jgi:ABC-type sugar transport system substrate-binding protein